MHPECLDASNKNSRFIARDSDGLNSEPESAG